MTGKAEQTCKRLCAVYTVFAVLFGAGLTAWYCFHATPYYVLLAAMSMLMPFLPTAFYRALRLRPVWSLSFACDIFTFLAFTGGMSLAMYKWLPFFDKAVHTLSGVFFSLLGLVVFYLIKPKKERVLRKEDWLSASLCSFTFSMTIAALWELYEYGISFILPTDPQNVLTTGVGDTMQDILVCLVGTLLLQLSIYFYYKRGRKSLFMNAFDVFFHLNLTDGRNGEDA